MPKTIVLFLTAAMILSMGLVGRGKMIDVQNPSRPGTKDVVRVEIVEVLERHIGERREMVLCVKIRNVTKQIISTSLKLFWRDRSMMLPAYTVHLHPGGTDMVLARIDLRVGEGLDTLSELRAEITEPSYRDP